MTRLIFISLLLFLSTASAQNHSAKPHPITTRYTMVVETLEDGTMAIARGDIISGQGWYRKNNRWVLGRDNRPLPESQYSFTAKAFKLRGWVLVRMDTLSGRTWLLIGDRWKVVRD